MAATATIVRAVMYNGNEKVLVCSLPNGKRGCLYNNSRSEFPLRVLVGSEFMAKIVEEKDNIFILEKCDNNNVSQTAFKIGERIIGTVTSFLGYGAFIALSDGSTGFMHINDMFESPKHPSSVLKLGEKVDVYVKNIDKTSKKIFFSQYPIAKKKNFSLFTRNV